MIDVLTIQLQKTLLHARYLRRNFTLAERALRSARVPPTVNIIAKSYRVSLSRLGAATAKAVGRVPDVRGAEPVGVMSPSRADAG